MTSMTRQRRHTELVLVADKGLIVGDFNILIDYEKDA